MDASSSVLKISSVSNTRWQLTDKEDDLDQARVLSYVIKVAVGYFHFLWSWQHLKLKWRKAFSAVQLLRSTFLKRDFRCAAFSTAAFFDGFWIHNAKVTILPQNANCLKYVHRKELVWYATLPFSFIFFPNYLSLRKKLHDFNFRFFWLKQTRNLQVGNNFCSKLAISLKVSIC